MTRQTNELTPVEERVLAGLEEKVREGSLDILDGSAVRAAVYEIALTEAFTESLHPDVVDGEEGEADG